MATTTPSDRSMPEPANGSNDLAGAGPTAGARLLAVACLCALVLLSGTLLNRAGTSGASGAPPRTAVASGAWFCPHGGGTGWTGWVAVANPGATAVRVRTTTFGRTGPTLVRTFMVGPSREVYRAVPVADPGSSTEVEYFGGWVAAGAVVRSSGSGADVAAERCVDGLRRAWFLPDATTAPDEHASIVVVNPYDTAAEFNVVIRTNQRTVRPGALTPVVLEPRTATSIGLNTWALEGPNEDAVSVQIVPLIGGVVAGSSVVSPSGLRAEAGIPAAATHWVMPAAGYGAPIRLAILNAGRARGDLTVIAQGPKGPNTIPEASGVTVPAGAARTFDVGQVADAGIFVDSGKGPLAAALRVAGPNGGQATIAGWSAPARRWMVPPALPATGGSARLVVQNPAASSATVRIVWIGPNGSVPAGAATVRVQAGRTVAVDAPSSEVPLFALVIATEGSVVVGETAQSLGSAAFAGTSGIPLP